MTQRSWDRRLDNARRRGYFNVEDEKLAMDFLTCAVSEHKGALHNAHPEDLDEELLELGMDFAGNISADNGYDPEARRTYRKIQNRVKELLANG